MEGGVIGVRIMYIMITAWLNKQVLVIFWTFTGFHLGNSQLGERLGACE